VVPGHAGTPDYVLEAMSCGAALFDYYHDCCSAIGGIDFGEGGKGWGR